jgi:hexosaminidase
MVADWHGEFELRGTWLPGAAEGGRYRLALTYRGARAVAGFRLGFSGQVRIAEDADIDNGRLVTQLSNYAELAPPPGFSLAPGATWTVEIGRLQFPLRHWTDGATAGFVVLDDGRTIAARTLSTTCANSEPGRRGTMRLGGEPAPVAIVPWPNAIAVTGRRTPPQGLAPAGDERAVAAFRELTEVLFPGEGCVRPAHEDGLPVRLEADPALAPEAYRLSLAPEGATLRASDHSGRLYGLITLAQMLRGARFERQTFAFPAAASIEDAPAMGFRGCHLDVARRFYGVAEVKRFLAVLSWNKLNRFHWHLSDDEAWRVEIDAYPALTRIGAWRGHGLALPPLLGSGPERSGGYYSRADIAELVGFAGRMGIEVIPEIDVPGHCYAMLQALPELRDPGENGVYQSIQSFPGNCLNPAVEGVYGALETIFAELLEMCPGRYFHVGADEVPAGAWATSPAAAAMRAQLGSGDAAPLQAAFLRRIQDFLTARGKITGAWQEAAHGGGIDKAACYLVGWVDIADSQALAAAGYPVVVAPGQAYYLDMANGPDWHEPGAGWAGWSSPEKTYAFDPTAGWSAAEREKFLGVQACIWSEPMGDRAVFDRLVFPRLSAIAETGWTRPEHKDFSRFGALAGLLPNLYGCREGAVPPAAQG